MTFELGGRRFEAVGVSTVRHHYSTMALLARAGLFTPARKPDEELPEYGNRILLSLVEADVALDLLAHLIVPEGVRWTPEVAKATLAFVGELKGKEDQERVDDLVVSALVPFFEGIESSARSSPTSSAVAAAARASARNRGGSGRPSFVRWLGAIGTRLAGSRNGRSTKRSPLSRTS